MAGFPLPGGRLAGIKGFGYKREEGKHDFKGEVHYYVDTPPTPPANWPIASTSQNPGQSLKLLYNKTVSQAHQTAHPTVKHKNSRLWAGNMDPAMDSFGSLQDRSLKDTTPLCWEQKTHSWMP